MYQHQKCFKTKKNKMNDTAMNKIILNNSLFEPLYEFVETYIDGNIKK